MTEPQVHLTQDSGPPNALMAVLDEYRDRPLVSSAGRGRFIGRVVIEVWLDEPRGLPAGLDVAFTWTLPRELDHRALFAALCARTLDKVSRLPDAPGAPPAGTE